MHYAFKPRRHHERKDKVALGGFIKTVVTSVIGWVGSALGGGASLQREKAATEQAKADAKKADAEKAGHVTNQRAIEVLKDELESQRKTKIVPVGEVRATQGEQESPGIK